MPERQSQSNVQLLPVELADWWEVQLDIIPRAARLASQFWLETMS